jgi:AcrR family transcriptional regulator
VPSDDWLVGGDRRTVAAERILAAATDLMARVGPDAFNIDMLAERVHCSRATIYRHVGGKADILEEVTARAAGRIVDHVRRSVDGLSGPHRVMTAITVAVEQIRSDPARDMLLDSVRGARGNTWLTASPAMAGFATELTGLADDDPQSGQFIVRLVLSLLFWPGADADIELEMLERFVAPAFAKRG